MKEITNKIIKNEVKDRESMPRPVRRANACKRKFQIKETFARDISEARLKSPVPNTVS